MKRLVLAALSIGWLLGSAAPLASAAEVSVSKAGQVLDRSTAERKYTFLLFYRENNAATRAMVRTLKQGVANLPEPAAVCVVSVADPAEQSLVKRFGMSRAPLPFTLAVAPNGAITAVFSQKLSEEELAGALVTPKMAECMRSMQDHKLVLICVHEHARGTMPDGVRNFQSDPEFKDRVRVISLAADDPAEAAFLEQMEINPAQVKTSSIVFLAPPAVLVGKFGAATTKAEMAAALHKAGHCCDNPNCKHAQGSHGAKGSGKR